MRTHTQSPAYSQGLWFLPRGSISAFRASAGALGLPQVEVWSWILPKVCLCAQQVSQCTLARSRFWFPPNPQAP